MPDEWPIEVGALAHYDRAGSGKLAEQKGVEPQIMAHLVNADVQILLKIQCIEP